MERVSLYKCKRNKGFRGAQVKVLSIKTKLYLEALIAYAPLIKVMVDLDF